MYKLVLTLLQIVALSIAYAQRDGQECWPSTFALSIVTYAVLVLLVIQQTIELIHTVLHAKLSNLVGAGGSVLNMYVVSSIVVSI